jgi:hypothetical protein
MTAVGSALLTWLTGGSALAALAKVLLFACVLALGLIYRRYLGILGADRRRAAERQGYDGLRNSLAEGNLAVRLYAEWLTRFLDWIDRFFGDAGMADRTLFPNAFGLRTPAPLWTAPALDRCLLLALIYPIAMIFLIWAVSGRVGPAEAALHLQLGFPAWQRGLLGLALLLLIFSSQRFVGGFRYLRRRDMVTYWKGLAWGALGCVVTFAASFAVGLGATGLIILAGIGAFNTALGVAVAGIGIGAGVIATALAFGMATLVALNRPTSGIAFVFNLAFFCAFALLVGVLVLLSRKAIRDRWEGVFLSLFLPALILACFGGALSLATVRNWDRVGPILLFFGLLTLLNAPFDWASLGLTRALLRRGLEPGGWWPYGFALVDAALAAVIIAALALTMVVGVQAFDALAVHGGGSPVLPLDALFTGIAEHPSAPEYWWLYALLLSTMIPSLVNLVISGASLVRGLPGLSSLLLRYIPERGGVLKWDRHWIATVLTFQVASGAALGIAAQALLVVGVIGYVLPWFALDLLDMAEAVAAFNLPARVGQLLGGIP